MKNVTAKASVLILLFSFLFISCEGENLTSVSLTDNSPTSLVYLDEETSYNGLARGDVSTVRITLNGEEIEEVGLSDGKFDFKMIFTELGEQKLNLEGLNTAGTVVAEAKYLPQVTERSAVGDDEMFDFTFPSPSKDSNSTLWATYYYLPQVSSVSSGGHALRDLQGNPLGPVLSKRDWCNSAMEGSVRVLDSQGRGVTYNYLGTSSVNAVDCTSIFPRHPKTGQVKFRLARGSFGDGVKTYRLIPFRTIAVDRSVIPYGSVVYIPSARGNKVTLPDGTQTVHDGYFFAGDTGGAIIGNHIDVYIGVAKTNPFSWVKSNSSGTFKAHIVTDQTIINKLTELHIK